LVEDSGFVRRWSQRKAEAQEGARRRRHGGAQPALPTAPVADPANPIEPLASLGDLEMREDQALTPGESPQEETPPVEPDSLPDIDTLDNTSDYTPFMQAGVPDELRSKALKRLWQLDPLFNEVDGLVEYGEDFSISHKIAKSLYRVGKGMLTDEEHAALDEDSPYVPPDADETGDSIAAPEEVSEDTTDSEHQRAESGPEEMPSDEPAEKGKNSQTRPS
jgi:hypothetical protein